MGDTRIKINLREGTFELEGSESFVEKHWSEFKSLLNNPLLPSPSHSQASTNQSPETAKKAVVESKSKKSKSFQLIPLDLKGGKDRPSLIEFSKEKSPANAQEYATLFAYYLKHYLRIEDMEPGHALYCFTEIKVRKPLHIDQLFWDTASRKGSLEAGGKSNSTKITIGGENLIEHELPRKKKSD
jgi:hypothetical protein